MANIYNFKSREEIIKEQEQEDKEELLESIKESFMDDNQLCLCLIYSSDEYEQEMLIIPNQYLMDGENMLKAIALLDQAKYKMQDILTNLVTPIE